MKAQKVCDVRRITIRRDGQVLNTKHLILTFSTPDLPQTVKNGLHTMPVRPYIPNPLRCFQCQRYGHSKNVCRGQPTCPRCGESGHDSADCKKKEQCLNCKGLVLQLDGVPWVNWRITSRTCTTIPSTTSEVSAVPDACQMTGRLPPLLGSMVGGGVLE
ncbi:putative RNA-directed DNA polymerase from transposon X-element [Trichonephila clavipes]|uniref:Putative RNA-directed DNA polymerase from transposon X-element n=1 Tax=Trichonephila clavipes TaxID=2585209 RepID=A0A8X6RRL7_TRICX|nr:putative RNA-directed DNA polymerase from transposon X-element [Trichonephila clavipes]